MKLSTSLNENKTSSPRSVSETSAPVTDAISKGMNIPIVTSARITSILNITPATGELKIAEIAPAAPQPINKVLFL